MTVGMACIAGTVMILYATLLNGIIPDPLGHILVASLIHVAAAITIARIMVPETGEEPPGADPGAHCDELDGRHCPGTSDGLVLLLNIAAMLLVMVALVQLSMCGGPSAECSGTAAHAAKTPRLHHVACGLALWHSVVAGADRGIFDGNEPF